jgi:uncharacterized membrane protein YeaQ/YmgE (transglycosylase-associated protein family)
MDIVSLIISLISGAVGGNVAAAAAPDKSLGGLGNSLVGLLGGGLGGYVLQALDLFNKVNTQVAQTTGTGLDLTSILANVGTGGVSGAILTIIVGLIKNSLAKR